MHPCEHVDKRDEQDMVFQHVIDVGSNYRHDKRCIVTPCRHTVYQRDRWCESRPWLGSTIPSDMVLVCRISRDSSCGLDMVSVPRVWLDSMIRQGMGLVLQHVQGNSSSQDTR